MIDTVPIPQRPAVKAEYAHNGVEASPNIGAHFLTSGLTSCEHQTEARDNTINVNSNIISKYTTL